ncbi:transposase [Patescibacteria group bacterium]|nr:transposase [Patescibacteria group bacterium]MBU4069750.1 transposase [Nanoarchaeota archaeon]
MINHEQLVLSCNILRHFINESLGLDRSKNVSGFELCEPLLDAVAYNTYIETVSNKADILYLRIKESLSEMTTYSYLNYISRLSKKLELNEKKVMLAFDYTDEDFYGDVQGFDIHGWTGKEGITGKFKFLTCSIISDDIPEKIPLISLPIQIGHYKSSVIIDCLSKIKSYIGEIDLILFDRGFYDKDLMYELTKLNYPYLIFVPKHQDKQSILYPMEAGEEIAIYNEFTVNKNQSKYPGENILVFLKQIYDKKSEKNYDWVFATNVEEVLLENLVITYKKRWRIETQFRVQDEARIKCKSKEMKVRYFLFLFEQMLQTMWICFYKNECSFKQFLIEIKKTGKSLTENPKRSYSKRVKA